MYLLSSCGKSTGSQIITCTMSEFFTVFVGSGLVIPQFELNVLFQVDPQMTSQICYPDHRIRQFVLEGVLYEHPEIILEGRVRMIYDRKISRVCVFIFPEGFQSLSEFAHDEH